MDDLKGLCNVEFVDGSKRDIPIEKIIIGSTEDWVRLITVDGRIYNWANIRSIKRSK